MKLNVFWIRNLCLFNEFMYCLIRFMMIIQWCTIYNKYQMKKIMDKSILTPNIFSVNINELLNSAE